MELDYQLILNELGTILEYCLPIGILIGLIERVCSLVIRAATGKAGD